LDRVLGLILLVVYIVTILGISASITWAVVKIFPTERTPKRPADPDAPSSSGGVDSAAGRLFRRAKRGTA
jgi:hypothetical protein